MKYLKLYEVQSLKLPKIITVPQINFQQMLLNKQMHSIKEAEYFKAVSQEEKDEINSIFQNLRDELGSSGEHLSVTILSNFTKDYVKVEFPGPSVRTEQGTFPIGENSDIFEIVLEIKEAKERLEEIGFNNRYFHVDFRKSNLQSNKQGMTFNLTMDRIKTI